MMIGALKPFLRRMRGLAPVDVRQADIHDHEIDLAGLAACTPLVPLSTATEIKLLMQRKLLDQCVAQFGIVIHDQDFSGIRHRKRALARISPIRWPCAK
jgi:hypothetical protein